jgi:Domain of unknown function (DUF6531)
MRSRLALVVATLVLQASAFAQFTITSFSISPSSAVGLSSQQYTENVTISRAPGYENNSVAVRCACQTYACSADILLGGGVNSGQASFSPPVLSGDSSDTVVAKVFDYNGNLLDSKSSSITILANKPTASFSRTAVVSGDSIQGTVTLTAALPSGQGDAVDFSNNGGISAGPWIVPYGGQSVSGNGFAGSVDTPTSVTVTPEVNTGYVFIPGPPVNFTIFPAIEPSLPCPWCEAQVGFPINLLNGNVWVTQRDYSIPGLGGGLTLERTWNSLWQSNRGTLPASGMFGDSWRSTYEEQLTSITSSSILYFRSNGDAWWFQWNSTAGNYQVTNPPNQHVTLVGGTQYTMIFADGTKRVFSNSGYLTTLIDRNNNQTSVTYDSSSRLRKNECWDLDSPFL